MTQRRISPPTTPFTKLTRSEYQQIQTWAQEIKETSTSEQPWTADEERVLGKVTEILHNIDAYNKAKKGRSVRDAG